MQYIKRLPLLFALLAAIISGITGISNSMEKDGILLRMIITMVVFYSVGFFVRYNLMEVYNQVKEKKEKEKAGETEENASNEKPENEQNLSEEKQDNVIDFEPLKVSKFIRDQLNKPNV